jgi:hypothetical protein
VTFFVKAYHSPSTDGDHFVFAYSTDNSTFTQLLTVTKTSDDGAYRFQSLPSSLRGRVYIRARDTNHSAGLRARDTLFVDPMYIRSE